MEFGKTSDGVPVKKINLKNSSGLEVDILTFGACVQAIRFPNKSGVSGDLVLGYDNVQQYEDNSCYFGVAVGRVAGRIKNASFKLKDKTYNVTKNYSEAHCIHGGRQGISKVVWEIVSCSDSSVTLSYQSVDGHEGFPGDVKVNITYDVSSNNQLKIFYEAKTSAFCPINLTNHSYFNLAGHNSGPVYDHWVAIHGDRYVHFDEDIFPDGQILPVEGTLLKLSGNNLSEHIHEVMNVKPGYDNYYVFQNSGKLIEAQAIVKHKSSGRVLKLYTDQVGVVFYTGNFLEGVKGKDGAVYGTHGALCLEAQNYPDAVNHPNFPSIIVSPNETYTQTTIYEFSLE